MSVCAPSRARKPRCPKRIEKVKRKQIRYEIQIRYERQIRYGVKWNIKQSEI